jgi:hypothetical protein
VAEVVRPRLGKNDRIPEAVARDYCLGDAQAKQEARETFARLGLTEDHVMAEAMQRCGAGLGTLGRLDKHCGTQIRLLQKDMARRTEPRRNGRDQADEGGT